MQASIQALLEVQDKDTRVHKLREIIASVPSERERIENELSGTEDLVEAAKQGFMAVEARIKEVELDIEQAQNKMIDFQQKTAAVKKNEEYKALLSEIETCKQNIGKHEDRQLEIWEELEAAKENRRKADAALAAAKTRIEAALQDLDVRQQNCSAQIDKVMEERATSAQSVDQELLGRYERLVGRAAKKGAFRKSLVPLQGSNCGGCFLQVTPQTMNRVKKNQLVPCEQCGALLYFTTGSGE
jgi:predicted  nucleic acid-binding Zn-ribbon protein